MKIKMFCPRYIGSNARVYTAKLKTVTETYFQLIIRQVNKNLGFISVYYHSVYIKRSFNVEFLQLIRPNYITF